ncbi:MAG: transglycosylase SLT domain-containing protein [Pseudomonadota bacterium]|nr:transglycosylase SLT domain-containing protein [Pseudomonadota bacterium]
MVYEVLRFSPDTSVSDRQRTIEARKEFYQGIIQRLAAGERSNLTLDEAKVLALWPMGVSNAILSQAVCDIRFQVGQGDRCLAGYEQSGLWLSYTERAFAARGLPKELALLPQVEFSFNPNVYPKVGAAGMWQFIPSAGQQFMRIDYVLDKCLVPCTALHAAVEFLALNHAVTGT